MSTTAVLLICVLGTQWPAAIVYASDEESASGAQPALPAATVPLEPRPRLVIDPSHFTAADESNTFAQRRGVRGRGRSRGGGRNEAARTALVVGTLATITGAALLVYANRPECRRSSSADACSYGTKVIGGAVLAAGAVGIVAGTVSWR
jgi:hypothetical protein